MAFRTGAGGALLTVLIALASLLMLGAAANELTGRVVAVADGDTITIETPEGDRVKIRLTEVDAPEDDQPWGDASRRLLSDLVMGKTVQIQPAGTDRFGRTLGRVYLGRQDVNAEMVRRGGGWAFLRYQKDPNFSRIEAEARAARRGLWAQADPTPPWDWRTGAGTVDLAQSTPAPGDRGRSQSPVAALATGFGPCGTKTRCSQMRSCEEARYYLRQCRVPTIDGDRDGVPCESLCAGR